MSNSFQDAVNQIEQIIKSNQLPVAFIGSSLGGYYASYFSSKYNSKAVLINPAIPPLEGFDIYLGENEITVFFDKKTLDLKGWQIIDQYNNNINFSLNIVAKNDVFKKGTFKIPEMN